MSQQIHLELNAHNSIYNPDFSNDNYQQRKILVNLGIPESGTTSETGMLILIPGYGGTMHSKVFQKMSVQFADEYNLIVMQCDYFGNRFMDNDTQDTIPQSFANELANLSNLTQGTLTFNKDLHETENEFNDMGFMQALDVVAATLQCLYWLPKNNLYINTKKIILFGSSHGGYIAHLANLICPDLFSCLIDISTYVRPYYIDKPRTLSATFHNCDIDIDVKYFIMQHPEYQYHKDLYDLSFLYHDFDNHCRIFAYHGTLDKMVNYKEKSDLINKIGSTAQLVLIHPENIDGIICKSAGHSLSIDFFEFFKMLMPLLDSLLTEKSTFFNLPKEITLGNSTASLSVSYEHYLPELLHITFC